MSKIIPMPDEIQRAELIRAEVGSTLYGTGLAGTEDTDYMGVCIEPWRSLFGLENFEHWIWRSQPEGVRSGFGDIDISVYGLRKYLSLAVKGNPSILLLLFVPEHYLVVQTELGEMLQALAPSIVSRRVVAPYIGYATAQLDRLTGKRGGAHVNRPELVEKFGYDTKYAMHALRLAYQGSEILYTGRIEVPIPNPYGDVLRAVRQGEIPKDHAIYLIEEAIKDIRMAETETSLPDEPDMDAINEFMLQARISHYEADKII